MDESPVKAEGANVRYRAGYKSWKKKYRKMRIVFDQKMHDGEELHKQEDKAAALVKRLAVENEYALEPFLYSRMDTDVVFFSADYWIYYSRSTTPLRSPQRRRYCFKCRRQKIPKVSNYPGMI